MRKKLLALLMCATMVLGTGVSAFAADYSATDITNAQAIINQYKADKGAIVYEYDAKTEPVTFTTEYIKTTSGKEADILYTYAFLTDGTYVKTDAKGTTAYTKTTGIGFDILTKNQDNHAISFKAETVTGMTGSGAEITNPSQTSANLAVGSKTASTASAVAENYTGSVFKDTDGSLYYGTLEWVTDTTKTLAANQYKVYTDADMTGNAYDRIGAATTISGAARNGYLVVTLKKFTKDDTGSVLRGSDAKDDTYGIDKDGYIVLKDDDTTKLIAKYSAAVAKDYWVEIKQADDVNTTAIARALADGTISKNAVAVQINFYKTLPATNANQTKGTDAVEYGFQQIVSVAAEIADTEVTFKSDWLSRSNAKNANTVYVLDPYVSSWSSYYTPINTIYKVSDLADEKFSTKYIASGVYLFDYVEDASQNDGVSDTDTTTTTTAAAATSAETAATSPKTGDVAPIAALAVVMMGACGAMVVASKKRA